MIPYIDSSFQEENKNMQLEVYNLNWANDPSNKKWGGVCILYKETLGVCTECIICEVSISNSQRYIGIIYRSQSQDIIEFEDFLSNFEKVQVILLLDILYWYL